MRWTRLSQAGLACLLLLAAPSPAPAQAPRQRVLIGLIPELNIFKQKARFGLLGEYLSRRAGVPVQFTILSRYGNIIERFQSEGMDGAFFGSFTGALAIAKLGVVPLARPVNLDGSSSYQGYLGHTISIDDRTEFGELAANFNAMSAALRDGYVRLQAQVEERRLAEEALRASEERYALAAQGANDGLWDWDLDRGRIYLSPRWKSMLGYAEGEISSDPEEWFSRIHADDRAGVRAQIAAHVEGDSPNCESEYRIRHADGSYLWVVCRGIAVRDQRRHANRLVGSQTDITARKRAEQQLIHDALHDALTGLPNRALFVERLAHAIDVRSRHATKQFAVLFLDLDRFKVINDSLGHLVGDDLLVAVGRRLAGCVRPGDTVARLGGDEFGLRWASP